MSVFPFLNVIEDSFSKILMYLTTNKVQGNKWHTCFISVWISNFDDWIFTGKLTISHQSLLKTFYICCNSKVNKYSRYFKCSPNMYVICIV